MAEPRCAIVGGGLAGLVGYAALRRAGLAPGEIVVLGDEPDPGATLRRRAAAIRQRRMRSESDGHVLPTAFPGLAVRAAVRELSPLPVLRSACNAYRPTVGEFFDHVDEVRESSGWNASFRRHRAAWVAAADGGFDVDGVGMVPHVLLAPGHPGLAVPDRYADDPRAVHAYLPHDYAERVAVLGAGMAAAMEWRNALAAGASVVSVRRREPSRRPLSVPRSLFSRRGLAGFQATPTPERALLLRRLGAPSYPANRGWDRILAEAASAGRFTVVTGEQAADLDVEQVICVTGFRRGFGHDALLARLVEEHALATADRWVVLDPDCTVPGLTDGRRTLALAGAPAQWAYPGADTVVGAKYAARRFAARVAARVTGARGARRPARAVELAA